MYAAIDVGTNTVRLLLAEVSTGKIAPVHYCRKITRLGGCATTDKGLAPEAMERTLSALREMSAILRQETIFRTRAVGTAALRDAPNGQEFLETVRAETGLAVEIIGGEEEARLCARGVLAALEPSPQSCLIFDIGGGSTEFIVQAEGRTLLHRSYPLGVVTLSENYPSPERRKERITQVLDAFCSELADSAHGHAVVSPGSALVGTAGTVTTLAALHLAMTEYDWRRVNNLTLERAALTSLLLRLAELAPRQREALPGMEEGRGDLIVPGLQIVLELMRRFGKDRLTVSDFGLLEGIVLIQSEEERKS